VAELHSTYRPGPMYFSTLGFSVGGDAIKKFFRGNQLVEESGALNAVDELRHKVYKWLYE